MTGSWRSECANLEQARTEVEELAKIASDCARDASMADNAKKLFETEVADHHASHLEAWRHSEQHQEEVVDFCMQMRGQNKELYQRIRDESSAASSYKLEAQASAGREDALSIQHQTSKQKFSDLQNEFQELKKAFHDLQSEYSVLHTEYLNTKTVVANKKNKALENKTDFR